MKTLLCVATKQTTRYWKEGVALHQLVVMARIRSGENSNCNCESMSITIATNYHWKCWRGVIAAVVLAGQGAKASILHGLPAASLVF